MFQLNEKDGDRRDKLWRQVERMRELLLACMHDMGLNAQQADIAVAAAVEIEEESQGSAKTCIYAATTVVA